MATDRASQDRRHDSERSDALIVVPPPSPSDTNPPLGPAIIAAAAARRGLRVEVLDLNIRIINRFRYMCRAESATLGDHGKDRAMVAAAATWLFENTGLRTEPPLHSPDVADPVAGMHFSLASISRAVTTAAQRPEPWRSWIRDELRSTCPRPPAVVGVSLMGPSQVFVGLLVLALAKELWPATVTALGGSHTTLLADELRRDGRYGAPADVVMAGHCENQFATLVSTLVGRGRSATPVHPVPALPSTPFEYFPLFSPAQLAPYEPARLTLPVQFTRGCVYGRCTFCTYPVVEPATTSFHAAAARQAVAALATTHLVSRFSLKDSLFTAPMLSAFAEALLAPPALAVRWSATTKANRALIGLASRLAASGLSTVEVGVETISRTGQDIFDKRADPAMVEELVLALTEAGITVVVNLIFGYPGQRLADAERQLDWFAALRQAAPTGRVDCSLNMLELVRGSPLVARPPAGVELIGVAPWAFSYRWNAPPWRRDFSEMLRATEFARSAAR